MSAAKTLGDFLVAVLFFVSMLGVIRYHIRSGHSWLSSDVGRMMMSLLAVNAVISCWWVASALFGSQWPGWDLTRFLVAATVLGVCTNVVRVMSKSLPKTRKKSHKEGR